MAAKTGTNANNTTENEASPEDLDTLGADAIEAVNTLYAGLMGRAIMETPGEGEGEGDQPARSAGDIVTKALEAIDNASEMVATAEAELNGVQRQLSAQKGAATKARAKAEALEQEFRIKARTFRPPAGNDALLADELMALADDATQIELAFCAGSKEITDIAPRTLSRSALAQRRGAIVLTVDSLSVRGREGAALAKLDGYALLLDGECVAIARRIDPLEIPPGKQFELKDDVIF